MSYIGNIPTSAAFLVDTFSGDASTTTFTMTVAPATTSSMLVAVSGVLQAPTSYNILGNTLTFTGAPPTGSSNISVRYLGVPASVVGGVAGGSNTQVQYNSGNSLAGSANMTFDGSTLTTLNSAYTGTLTGGTGIVNLGSGQFYKDASGNVGINTTSMFGKFNLKQSNEGAGTNAASGLTVQRSANDSYLGIQYQTTPDAWAISSSYSSTGAYKPLIFETSDSERMRITSAGNVGIGISSPAVPLDVNGQGKFSTSANAGNGIVVGNNINGTLGTFGAPYNTANVQISNTAGPYPITFVTNSSEAMRIDGSGNLLVGTTSAVLGSQITCAWNGNSKNGMTLNETANYTGATFIYFSGSGTACGNISRVGTTNAVVYGTSSDYRLKTVIGSVSDAGERIDALEPIEYEWKVGGRTRGFLAHQFAEVYPTSVSGEKDAVDAEGKPIYQSMQASTSEVMADLIAEIQSLRKRIATLEAK